MTARIPKAVGKQGLCWVRSNTAPPGVPAHVHNKLDNLAGVPVDQNPLAVAALTLAAAGIIAADGYVMSSRPEAHARPVTRWVIRDRAKATAWLRDNPEIADPPKPEPSVDQPSLFETTEPGVAAPGPDSTAKWRAL